MSLERVLNATSVAIVGASKNEAKRGHQAIRTLLEEKFEGTIYPVNPNESRILGLDTYPRVSAIEGPVDLVLITTPAGTVVEILEDCAQKDVAGAVVVAGGFGELGKEGRELESRIVDAARHGGIRLIGPNTSGMINVKTGLNLAGIRQVPRGDIALLSQSGNMALTLITEASVKSQKGFSYYVGVGNEADIQFHEYLEFLQQDEQTRAILLYVEGMRDGRRFVQQAYETSLKKPIVLLKSGRSDTGRRSAGSHTGALAGISEVARSAFRRAGVVMVDHSDKLFPAAETLSSLPPVKQNSAAILADGGGHATIAVDFLSDFGIKIPSLRTRTLNSLRKVLPGSTLLSNPLDLAGAADANPGVFADCARRLLQDPEVGSLLVVGLFGGYSIRFSEKLRFVEEDAAHRMGKLVRELKKPIVVHSLYNHARPHALDLLRYYGIPVFDSLEVASRCVAVLAEYGEVRNGYHAKERFTLNWGAKARAGCQQVIARALEEGRGFLLEPEAAELFRQHGAPVSDGKVATSPDEAAEIAASFRRPVALKVVSPQILHKSDSGCVKLGLSGRAQIRRGYREIIANAKALDADVRGILVTPMAEKGLEVIVGTKIDDQFGPVIMLGLGGIWVEVLNDVAFRVLPISDRTARMMIDDLRASKLLNGYRGSPPCDKRAIRKLLLKVSEIVEAYPEIREVDLNPVIVREDGIEIVDIRVILEGP